LSDFVPALGQIVSPSAPFISISPVKSGSTAVGTVVALKRDGRENKLQIDSIDWAPKYICLTTVKTGDVRKIWE